MIVQVEADKLHARTGYKHDCIKVETDFYISRFRDIIVQDGH
jgi:hypothetical protein